MNVLSRWDICVANRGNLFAWKIFPHCLMWVIWRDGNNHIFDGIELSVMMLKYLFLRVLFKWSCTLGNSDEHSIVDSIGSHSLNCLMNRTQCFSIPSVHFK